MEELNGIDCSQVKGLLAKRFIYTYRRKAPHLFIKGTTYGSKNK
jgi:hypothetical protein